MNISAETGALTFATGTVEPRLDRAVFLEMTLAKSAERIPGGTDWQNFRFNPEPDVFASAYFNDGKLKNVSLAFRLLGEVMTPWGSNCEQERRLRHEAWLRSQLGKPPYIFVWGEVFATSDLWTSDQYIDVRYSGPLGFRDRMKCRLRHWMRRLQEID